MRIQLKPEGSRAQIRAHSWHRCNRTMNRRHTAAACFASVGVWWVLLMLATPSTRQLDVKPGHSRSGGAWASRDTESRIGPLAAVAQSSVPGLIAGDGGPARQVETERCESNLSEWTVAGLGHPPKCWTRPIAQGLNIPRETAVWNASTDDGQLARRECVQRHVFAAHGLDTLREYFMQGCNVPPMLDFESWAQETGCGSEPLSGPLLIHTAWSGPYDHVREDMDALVDSFLATQVTVNPFVFTCLP